MSRERERERERKGGREINLELPLTISKLCSLRVTASESAGNNQLRIRVQRVISACCGDGYVRLLIFPNIFLNSTRSFFLSYHIYRSYVESLRHSKRRVSGNFFLALAESRAKYAVASSSRDLRKRSTTIRAAAMRDKAIRLVI